MIIVALACIHNKGSVGFLVTIKELLEHPTRLLLDI
jgi:pyruvate/2-oxoglutarate dehydrogenase complex dihydrolipoamide acyltransferase (E2) component